MKNKLKPKQIEVGNNKNIIKIRIKIMKSIEKKQNKKFILFKKINKAININLD